MVGKQISLAVITIHQVLWIVTYEFKKLKLLFQGSERYNIGTGLFYYL